MSTRLIFHLQAEQQLIHRVTTEQQHEHNSEQQVELQLQYDQLLERLKGRSSDYITLFMRFLKM